MVTQRSRGALEPVVPQRSNHQALVPQVTCSQQLMTLNSRRSFSLIVKPGRSLGTRCCGCVVLVDGVITSGYLLLVAWSAPTSARLDVCLRGLCLDQSNFFLGREVLNLYRE